MPRLHFRKANWTGEYDHLEILGDGKFKIDSHSDCVYRLEKTVDGVAEIKGSEWDDDYVIGQIFHWNFGYSDEYFTASGSGISRSHKIAFVAAAQLICNIV